MLDINTIAEKVQTEADADANIIFGAAISEEMQEKISVTIIATHFNNAKAGMDGIIDAPEGGRNTLTGKEVEVDGMKGREVDLNALFEDSSVPSSGSAEFDIPEFLR